MYVYHRASILTHKDEVVGKNCTLVNDISVGDRQNVIYLDVYQRLLTGEEVFELAVDELKLWCYKGD